MKMDELYKIYLQHPHVQTDTRKLQEGDLYVALELSRISGKPLDAVSTAYKSNKSKGWGFIAQSMGIKPGSQEFKLLKQRLDAKAEKHKKPAPGKSKKR